MNAEGIEVRNCFWLRTGTPLSGSCISRTSPSIYIQKRSVILLLRLLYLSLNFQKYLSIKKCKVSILSKSPLLYIVCTRCDLYQIYRYIRNLKKRNVNFLRDFFFEKCLICALAPCRRRKVCQRVAPSLSVVDC